MAAFAKARATEKLYASMIRMCQCPSQCNCHPSIRAGTGRATTSCRPCPTGTIQPYLDGSTFFKCPIRTSAPLRWLLRAKPCRPCPRTFYPPPGLRCTSWPGQVSSRTGGPQSASAARQARDFCTRRAASARGMRSRFAQCRGVYVLPRREVHKRSEDKVRTGSVCAGVQTV